jgi:hypothetical protein
VEAHVPRGSEAGRSLKAAWLGAALCPLGWIADLLVRYGVMRYASTHGVRWPLILSSTGGVAMIAAGAGLCLATLRRAAPRPDVDTIARWGLLLAAFFFLLVMAEAYPVLVLGPNEIT